MSTGSPGNHTDQQIARHDRDAVLREEFPVIVNFNRRLELLERKIGRIRDMTILNAAVGLGIALGELAENFGTALDWGWGAAATCGITILAVALVLRSYLK